MEQPAELTSQQIRQACRWEVLATKPGNVSTDHSFEDATVDDFLLSADVIAPVLGNAAKVCLGDSILNAVKVTKQAVGHNTNLGIVLLLTPLAAVRNWSNVRAELNSLLAATSVEDAKSVYEAIRIAEPGGLGNAGSQDVAELPSETLLNCMKLAADRDAIANEYASGFSVVLDEGIELLEATRFWDQQHEWRLAWVAVNLMSRHSDSLILRKCGQQVARTVQDLATETLESGWPNSQGSSLAFERLDRFLKDDGHRRNPGTTADLIAAILLSALRFGIILPDLSENTFRFADPTP